MKIVDADPDEGDAASIEIEIEFRRKIAGLRRLPWQARPHALRAAREHRQAALKALKERRAYSRYATYMLRRLQMPTPD